MSRLVLHRLLPVAAVLLLTCARALPPPQDVVPEVVREAGEGATEEEAAGVVEVAGGPRAGETPERFEGATMDPPRIPKLVRVGLATDLSSVPLPCCDGDLAAVVGDRRIAVVSNLLVEPGVQLSEPAVFRLQIAALRDERQAWSLASRIEESLGLPAAVVFDAGTGLYKVRAGRFESRDDAEAERQRLSQHNIHEGWIVSEQTPPRNPSLKLRQGKKQWLVRGRWLGFEPEGGGEGVSVLGKRYRGRVLVYLNDRGTLNVVNEVKLDDYLRGVVPREMGPEVFDNIEALKAQAVAARSYTLRNIGEFDEEGYDICATPRCQVYGGMGAEHPLSDRAVLETSGEVLVSDGSFADALYSSTCGGHTEDVEIIFPLKKASYLRGVPCHESGIDRITGSLPRGMSLEVGLGRILIPSGQPAGSASDFAARLKTLARLAGLTTRSDSLGSLERREVQRFIASQFDLAVDARLLVAQEDVPYLLESPPQDWSREDLRLAAYLVKVGLLTEALDRPLEPKEVDETLFQLGLFLRVLEERKARYLRMDKGRILVREGRETLDYDLPPDLATFSRRSNSFVSGPLAVVPGDRLKLFVSRGELVGIGHEVDLDGTAFDRTSNLSSWTRFRSDHALTDLIRQRYPAIEFAGLEILGRGTSGRVSRLRIHSRDQSDVEVQGLPIRWTLDLPDTLFTVKRLEPEKGTPGWLFTGRGWGHGVGMCQVGSYGMAVRGHDYRDILQHYYSGVELWKAPLENGPISRSEGGGEAG